MKTRPKWVNLLNVSVNSEIKKLILKWQWNQFLNLKINQEAFVF